MFVFCRIHITLVVSLIITFFGVSIQADVSNTTQTQRLSCFFYDKDDPYEDINVLNSDLPSVWAKGFDGENIYVSGFMRDGFFEISAVTGMANNLLESTVVANYENSYALAQAFCKLGLERAFKETHDRKELMFMRAKSSFLSIWHSPVVFQHQRDSYITQFNKLVVFGDSISDQGNLKNWLRVFPPPPYFFGRFTNKKNWVDFFSEMTGISVQNWAVGGSVTNNFSDLEFNNKSLSEKIRKQLRKMAVGSANQAIKRYIEYSLDGENISDADSTLYSVWIGGNDYTQIMESSDADIFLDYPDDQRIGFLSVANRVTDNIIDSIRRLYNLGARNFLVPDMPDLGKVPRILDNTTYHAKLYEPIEQKQFLLSKKMTQVSALHNAQLRTKLEVLRNELLGINLVFIDISGGLKTASQSISLEDGASYFNYDLNKALIKRLRFQGQTIEVNEGCFSGYWPNLKPNPHCIDVNRALFFDNIHPSSFGHCLIAWAIHQAAALANFIKPGSLNSYLSQSRPELVH